MANEIAQNYDTGNTLYSVRWASNGDVFLTNGSASEVWGTGGRDASDYAVLMAENVPDGHYVGDFDTSVNITTAGIYKVAVFLQVTGVPVDADFPLSQGEMSWDGTTEVSFFSLDVKITGLSSSSFKNTNVYGPGE
jgi:hypothetical protein